MTAIKKISVLFFVLLAIVSKQSFAQDNGDDLNMRAGQLKSFGKNAAAQGDYSSAAMYYEAYCKKRTRNYKITYKLAESYRLSKDYRNAELTYLKAYNLNPKVNALALFYYATMLKINGNYEKADEFYAKFKKEYKGKDKSEYLKVIKNNAKAAEFVKQMLASPSKVAINHLDPPINTTHVESSPVFINDSTVIYSSLKTDQKYFYFNQEDSSSNEPFRKLYTAKLKDGKWEDTGELNGPFNRDDIHTSNGVFSQDGSRFYFTRCKRNNRNKTICAIYVSNLVDGQWQEPVSLGDDVNDPDYTSTQPAVGVESQKNREVVYFVSDRESGKGGLDIWYTTYDSKKKTYKAPSNAGPKLNTAGDEMTPYFDFTTRTLYFSSDGWQGIGGLDIFKTNGELKKWSTPENLGPPVNSSYDDLYYVLSKDNKETGMFVSNRESIGTLGSKVPCCDDLFTFQWLDAVKLNLAGKLFEEADSSLNQTVKIPVKGARVFLEVKNPEDTTFTSVGETFSDGKGKFNLALIPDREYRLITKKDGYLNDVYSFNTNNKRKSEDLSLDMNLKPAPFDPIALQNIYYDYGKATLTEAAKLSIDTTLLEIMNNNPDIVIELGSHTDAIGSDAANMTLSQNRAQSVVDYLVAKGIDKKRVVAKGYGETRPIAPNKNKDGSDNPKGRQLNRRTEFRVLGRLREDGTMREPGNF